MIGSCCCCCSTEFINLKLHSLTPLEPALLSRLTIAPNGIIYSSIPFETAQLSFNLMKNHFAHKLIWPTTLETFCLQVLCDQLANLIAADW